MEVCGRADRSARRGSEMKTAAIVNAAAADFECSFAD